eukprot:366239-Chlamydomonas_euryale.AAC.18
MYQFQDLSRRDAKLDMKNSIVPAAVSQRPHGGSATAIAATEELAAIMRARPQASRALAVEQHSAPKVFKRSMRSEHSSAAAGDAHVVLQLQPRPNPTVKRPGAATDAPSQLVPSRMNMCAKFPNSDPSETIGISDPGLRSSSCSDSCCSDADSDFLPDRVPFAVRHNLCQWKKQKQPNIGKPLGMLKPLAALVAPSPVRPHDVNSAKPSETHKIHVPSKGQETCMTIFLPKAVLVQSSTDRCLLVEMPESLNLGDESGVVGRCCTVPGLRQPAEHALDMAGTMYTMLGMAPLAGSALVIKTGTSHTIGVESVFDCKMLVKKTDMASTADFNEYESQSDSVDYQAYAKPKTKVSAQFKANAMTKKPNTKRRHPLSAGRRKEHQKF